MENKRYNFKVDFQKNIFESDKEIILVQEDNKMISFYFVFIDEIEDGQNILLKIKHSKIEKAIPFLLEVKNQKSEIIIKNNVTSLDGKIDLSISYIGKEEEILTNPLFRRGIEVKKSLGETEEIPEQELEIVEDLISQLNKAKAEVEQLEDEIEEKLNNGEFNGEKGDTGPQGPRGDQGPQGETGPIGPKGDKGDTDYTYVEDKPNIVMKSDLQTHNISNSAHSDIRENINDEQTARITADNTLINKIELLEQRGNSYGVIDKAQQELIDMTESDRNTYLNNFVAEKGGEIVGGVLIYTKGTPSNEWEFNDTTQVWEDNGQSTVNMASNDIAGIVKGSLEKYKIGVDTITGEMSVNDLESALTDIFTQLTTKDTLPTIVGNSVLANVTGATGKPTGNIRFSQGIVGSSLAQRNATGQIKAKDAINDDEATTLKQLNEAARNLQSQTDALKVIGKNAGGSMSITDAIDGKGKLLPSGNTTQKVTVQGKNLLDISKLARGTKNGITVTVDEEAQEVTINGVCTADNTVFALSQNFIVDGANTAMLKYISGTVTKVSASFYPAFSFFDENFGNSLALSPLANSDLVIQKTFTGTWNTNRFRIDAGDSFENYKCKLMLIREAKTGQEEWEPFVPNSPSIENPAEIKTVKDSINIKVSNGADKEQDIFFPLSRKRIFLNGTESWVKSSTQGAVGYFTAHFSVQDAKGASTSGIANAESDKFEIVSRTAQMNKEIEGISVGYSGLLVLQIKADKLRTPDIAGLKAWLTDNNVMVKYELAEEFTPCYELCKIGDVEDKFIQNDKWQIEKNIMKTVFNGTENVAQRNAGNGTTTLSFNITLNTGNANAEFGVFCDKFLYNKSSTNGQEGIAADGKRLYIQILRSRLISYGFIESDTSTYVPAFTAWLADNNLIIYYVLVTPIYVDCTEEQSIVLDQMQNIDTYSGTTHVYSTDEVPPNMELTYQASLQQLYNKLGGQ